MSIDDHKALTRCLLEDLWSTGNLDLIDELFTADFLHHNVPDGTPRGPGGQRQFVPMIRAMVPNLRIAIDDLIAEDDRVAARWTGTYTDENGEPRSYSGVDILRFEGGKIAELWSFVP
jgi:predicted ester cyclase